MITASGKSNLLPVAGHAATPSTRNPRAAANNLPGINLSGIALAGAIAVFAFLLGDSGGMAIVGPMIPAIVIGMTEAHDEDAACAIACITLFGSIAILAYPFLRALLHLDSRAYGLWSGASIDEIVRVAAASFQNGRRAGEIGTLVKLARVILFAPFCSVHPSASP